MKAHPEQKDNEIYMGNCTTIGWCTWKTARYGNIAHYNGGGPIENPCGLRPWFIEKQELINAGWSRNEAKYDTTMKGWKSPTS